MRDYEKELKTRVEFIKNAVLNSKTNGIVFGNSGGKDSALVGILCKKACPETLGVIMPCQSRRNFAEDTRDALELAERFGIESVTVDITDTKNALLKSLGELAAEGLAQANIGPRLRMTTLYAIAQTKNRLVAGTGNRSEAYVGYFTKWGDGAYDLNPIADLTVTEVYEFLRFLGAPAAIIEKAPSAALFDGQTDESEMGVTYAAIDKYITTGCGSPEDIEIIKRMHRRSEHKRIKALTPN